MSALTIQLPSVESTGRAPAAPPMPQLRDVAQEFVGRTFFDTLLQIGEHSGTEAVYGMGGRGEEIFRGELNRELSQRAAGAFETTLTTAVMRQLTRDSASFEVLA